MFCLKLEKTPFYRLKKGQSPQEAERVLGCPVLMPHAGYIVCVEECRLYEVKPFETYGSVSRKFRIGEEELKRLNGGRILYPSMKIFIPVNKS